MWTGGCSAWPTGLRPIEGVGSREEAGRTERRAGSGLSARRPRRPARSQSLRAAPRRGWDARRTAPVPPEPRLARPHRGSPAATRRRPGAAPRRYGVGRGARPQVTLWSARPGPAGGQSPRRHCLRAGRPAGDAGRRGGAAGGRASPPGRGLRRPGPRPATREGGERGAGAEERAGCARGSPSPDRGARRQLPGPSRPTPAARGPGGGRAGAAPACSPVRAKAALADRGGWAPAPPQPRRARARPARHSLAGRGGSRDHFFGSVSDPVTRRGGLTPSRGRAD